MANEYYDPGDGLSRFSLARSAGLNAQFDALEAAFDKLPTEAEIKEARITFGTTGGSANAYTVTSTYPISTYEDGFNPKVKIHAANTGATTINFDARGVKAIKRIDGSDLQSGDLPLNAIVDLVYNGTTGYFVVTSLLADAVSAASSASAAASSATAAASSASSAASSATAAAAVLDDSILRDGSQPPTADTSWNSNKITSLAAGTARTNAANVGQIQDGAVIWGGTSGGSANAQTLTLSPAITAYVAGMRIAWLVGTTNTGATTVNVNSVGAVSLRTRRGAALMGGELIAGDRILMDYDGSAFRIVGNAVSKVNTSFPAAGEVTLTGIRADAERITLIIASMTTDGTASIFMQLGDSGGVESADYAGVESRFDATSVATTAFGSSSFRIANTLDGILNGSWILRRSTVGGNTWFLDGSAQIGTGAVQTICSGKKSLSANLDRIRLNLGGSDAFTAGNFTVIVE